jgi:hypothetical protein
MSGAVVLPSLAFPSAPLYIFRNISYQFSYKKQKIPCVPQGVIFITNCFGV